MPAELTNPIKEKFQAKAKDILSVVRSLHMIRTVLAITMELVSGYDEIGLAQTLHYYFQTKRIPCDSDGVLRTMCQSLIAQRMMQHLLMMTMTF